MWCCNAQTLHCPVLLGIQYIAVADTVHSSERFQLKQFRVTFTVKQFSHMNIAFVHVKWLFHKVHIPMEGSYIHRILNFMSYSIHIVMQKEFKAKQIVSSLDQQGLNG